VAENNCQDISVLGSLFALRECLANAAICESAAKIGSHERTNFSAIRITPILDCPTIREFVTENNCQDISVFESLFALKECLANAPICESAAKKLPATNARIF